MPLPNSLTIALPIKATHPRPSPIWLCPGQYNSPSSSSISGSCSSSAERLLPAIRAHVVGKCLIKMGILRYWEARCEHHLAAWIAKFWFLNAVMVSGWSMRGNKVGIWLGGCVGEGWGVFGASWEGTELEGCD